MHRDHDNIKRQPGFDRRTDAFKGFVPSPFVPSKQMALKQSDNKQRLPWTALKPSAFAGRFQNGLAGFETVWTASKLSDSFKAVWVQIRA